MSTASAGLAPAPSATPAVPAASALIAAAQVLLPVLARGQAVDARALRDAMTTAFGGSDADGLWAWKDAYEGCEVAQLLFPPPVRSGHARQARRGAARHARQGRRAPAHPYAPLRREPGAPAVLDADPARLRSRNRRRHHRDGRGAGTVRRDWAAGRLCRAGRCIASAQRTRRHPRRAARLPLSGRERHPLRRSQHRRPPRPAVAAERRADQSALLGRRARRGSRRGRRLPTHRVGAGAPGRRGASRRDHRRILLAGEPDLGRRLRSPAGARARRVHRHSRWPRLCASRHHDGDAADRHRPRRGQRSVCRDHLVGHGTGRDHAAGLGRAARSAASRLHAESPFRFVGSTKSRFHAYPVPHGAALARTRRSGRGRTGLRGRGRASAGGHPPRRGALRAVRPTDHPHPERAAAPDVAGTIGCHGERSPAAADLSPALACQSREPRPAFQRPARDRGPRGRGALRPARGSLERGRHVRRCCGRARGR